MAYLKEYGFRYECGVCQPSHMMKFNERDMHTIYSIKAELDQMITGLQAYGLKELVQRFSGHCLYIATP